ncbi:MAG: hypothetical protein PWP08_171 [Methanofollis sp.]|nr:hypothetical protein [Methanofollis sp.]
MREETVIKAGDARVAAGRAIVPIVRAQSVAGEGGFFLRVEPIGLLIAGAGWARLLSREDADVPDDVVAAALERARDALNRTRDAS